jgi:uncharacterized membrane protein
MPQIICYVTIFAIFAVIDFAWLVAMGPRLFRPTLGDILLAEINIVPAIVFYLIFPVGLMVFAVQPALKSAMLLHAMGLGALFGFLAYATYDLTNLATLRNWTVTLAAIDIVWGTMLSAVAAGAGYLATTRLGD